MNLRHEPWNTSAEPPAFLIVSRIAAALEHYADKQLSIKDVFQSMRKSLPAFSYIQPVLPCTPASKGMKR